MENIKAVIFDLDSTLGNRYIYAYQTYKDLLLLQKDLPYKPGSFQFEAMLQDLCILDKNGAADKEEVGNNFKKRWNYQLKVDGMDLNRFWYLNLSNHYVNFDDTIDTIKYLKSKGYKLGIITNGSEYSQNNKINKSQIKDYFDSIVISDVVKMEKPNKDIFDYSLKQLGVLNTEAVFVGDTFSYDILGALNAGILPIWMNINENIPCELNIKQIRNLSQLKEIL